MVDPQNSDETLGTLRYCDEQNALGTQPVLIPFGLGMKDADGGIVGASRKEWESPRMEPHGFAWRLLSA